MFREVVIYFSDLRYQQKGKLWRRFTFFTFHSVSQRNIDGKTLTFQRKNVKIENEALMATKTFLLDYDDVYGCFVLSRKP